MSAGTPAVGFEALRRRRRAQRVVETSAWRVATAATAVALLAAAGAPAIAWMLAAVAVMGVGAPAVVRSTRPDPADDRRLALHVDRVMPQAQESATLLLRSGAAALSPVEALQRRHVERVLAGADPAVLLPGRRALRALIAAAVAIGAAAAVLAVAERIPGASRAPAGGSSGDGAGAAAPVAPARLVAWRLEVEPPGYRGLEPRTVELDPASGADVAVEEGSLVAFALETAPPAAIAELLLPTGVVAMAPEAGTQGAFRAVLSPAATTLVAARAVFAEAVAAANGAGGGARERRTAWARLTVLADGAPAVRIVSPPPHLQRSIERPPQSPGSLEMVVEASDAEGLGDVELVMTVGRGGGEGVRFSESRLPMIEEARRPTTARLRRTIDFAPLRLEPGSEVYLYAEARDRRQPRANVTRSDAIRVRIAGGGQASSGLGRGVPVNAPAEYFRSQRQIILDTEQLLRDERRIPRAEFELRAQALGLDQQALRLRYGTLLGEEFESGAPVPEGAGRGDDGEPEPHRHAAEPPAHAGEEGAAALPARAPGGPETSGAPGSLLSVLPGGMVHLHDSEASATFFADPLRRQLKQVLAAMWDAEGRLRVFEPRAALPHEYEALRLLKDLQQQARAYVPKFSSTLPPVLLERRFAGDPSRILVADRVEDIESVAMDAARRAWTEWIDWRPGFARRSATGTPIAPADRERLAGFAEALAAAAADGRLERFDALDAAREVFEATAPPAAGNRVLADLVASGGLAARLDRVEAGLWSALPAASRSPGDGTSAGPSLAARFRAALRDREAGEGQGARP